MLVRGTQMAVAIVKTGGSRAFDKVSVNRNPFSHVYLYCWPLVQLKYYCILQSHD
jgi:hypothetical protein